MMIGHVAAGIAGAVTILWVLFDAFELMLLPRRAQRPLRFARFYFRTTWAAWRAMGRQLRHAKKREGFLAIYGPLSLLTLLVVWVMMLVAAFGALQWSLASPALSFRGAAYMSGLNFLTLGFADVQPHTTLGRALAVAAGGTGFGVLAVIIGYLPVLYQLFSRREAMIIRLDARAGSPPTAATLLVRYAEGQRLDALDALFLEWEEWASELLESHLSYPMLAFYRSQQEDESWVGALTAMVDTMALILTGFRNVNTFQARVTFGTARLTLMELARLFSGDTISQHGRDVAVSRLPAEEFRRLAAKLGEVGLEFSDSPGTADDAGAADQSPEQRLAEFRAAYEPYAMALSDYLALPLSRWVAPEGALDNWQRSKRGQQVKQLVEGTDAVPG